MGSFVGEPSLHMEEVQVESNKIANVKCEVYGYPHSNVTLAFYPCDSEIKCGDTPTHSVCSTLEPPKAAKR